MQEGDDQVTHRTSQDDAVTLADLVGALWHSRWIVLIGMSLAAALAVGGSLYFARYVSEGFFQFGGTIPIPDEAETVDLRTLEPTYYDAQIRQMRSGIAYADFKRFSAAYSTIERFSEYVQEKNLENEQSVAELRKRFASTENVNKLIEPVYSFSRLDAKQLLDASTAGGSNVIGLRISVDSHTPVLAREMAGLLGRYVMDSIIYFTYSIAEQAEWSENKSKLIQYENIILTNTERLAQHRRRAEDLRKIASRYPEIAEVASRQIVSVNDDSARYLPPLTLLATAEVQESETRELIRKARREQQKTALLLAYHERLRALTEKTKLGEKILRSLEPLRDEIFKGKDLEDDVNKQVYNAITIENQTAVNVYGVNSRFIAGPTLPSRSTARPLLMLVFGLFVGFVASVVLVFVRYWWRENRVKVRGY